MDSGFLDTEKMIEFAQALIQRPSLSGEEGDVAQRVVAEMQALGFDQVMVDENGSVIGIIEGATPGKTLLLDAHIDTVGVAEGVAWQRDPFGAEIVDQAIVGTRCSGHEGRAGGDGPCRGECRPQQVARQNRRERHNAGGSARRSDAGDGDASSAARFCRDWRGNRP